MKKTLLAVVAVGALAAIVTPAHAAITDPPVGRKCGFHSQTDFTAESQTQFGEADGGPLVSLAPGTLTCQIYVNGVAQPDASVSGHTQGAAAAYVATAAGTVTFHSVITDVIAECTIFAFDGGATVWWHPGAIDQPNSGVWESGAIDTTKCGQAIVIDPNPETCPELLTVDKYAGTNLAVIWQDCEPYSPII
jgi:hypothetical protein